MNIPFQDDFNPRRRIVATYGRFSVYLDPMVHLPWGLYRVTLGTKYIGAQISFPSESDCEAMAAKRQQIVLTVGIEKKIRAYALRGATAAKRAKKWRNAA